MSESDFSKKLRKGLTRHGVRCFRVESHSTCPGMPDIYGVCRGGFTFWIETKENAKADRIRYEPQQALWLENHWESHCFCCTILNHTTGHEIIIILGYNSRAAEKGINIKDQITIPYKGNWVDEVWEFIHSWNLSDCCEGRAITTDNQG